MIRASASSHSDCRGVTGNFTLLQEQPMPQDRYFFQNSLLPLLLLVNLGVKQGAVVVGRRVNVVHIGQNVLRATATLLELLLLLVVVICRSRSGVELIGVHNRIASEIFDKIVDCIRHRRVACVSV